ncbi:hypothetical protein GQ53DRAFT_758021 [Thozetella sp. PMI_491]|nr:hypothetical protein GQ53DRAFT_758021 [Thozetella sp. PMI_491]
MSPRPKRRRSSAYTPPEDPEPPPPGSAVFPLFPRLPLEVQDRVWELALYIPTPDSPGVHAFDLVVETWEINHYGVHTVPYDSPYLVDSAVTAHPERAPEKDFGPVFTSTNQAWRQVGRSCRRAFHALLRAQGLPLNSTWRHAIAMRMPRQHFAWDVEPIEDLFFLRFRFDAGRAGSEAVYSSLPAFPQRVTTHVTINAASIIAHNPFAEGSPARHRRIKCIALTYYPGFSERRAIEGGHQVDLETRAMCLRIQRLAMLCTDLKVIYLVIPEGHRVHPPRRGSKPRFEGVDIKFYEVRRIVDDEVHENMAGFKREICNYLRKKGVQVKYLTYRKCC